ncbi:MAG: zinc-ribbon domain containing protein, partial [Planctomycetaceae bacterium]
EPYHSLPEGPPEEVFGSYWRYGSERTFSESAIKADVSKQNYSMFPRPYYVDVLMVCADCRRRFVFFAKEQQYWYEHLGFHIDAWCDHCCECRKGRQQVKRQLQRYSELANKENHTDLQLGQLVDAAVFLWNEGALGNEQNLRRLKNLAVKQIPESDSTKAVCDMIDKL